MCFSMRGLWFDRLMGSREVSPQTKEIPCWDHEHEKGLQLTLGKYFWDSYI